ncbi:purine nucleoside permease [Rhexocercosporidium sp. MPI-PUGE-AT-0058]|nr:purine nucleoside permease [Rhexocercosporidium sp. MPI-PUGE-AT-0058]
MHFLGAAVSAVLAVRGVVALPVADTTATDSAIADDTTADTSSDDLVAFSTASYGIKPKVVIISHFGLEASVWYGIKDFNVLARNITVPGFSPRYPQAHCTLNGEICQVTTGEAEINAASTISALALSPLFDLTTSYFLVAGIADNFTTGYIPYGTQVPAPAQYPTNVYGTEVFEVNASLQKLAITLASKAKLSDDPAAAAYRQKYQFAAAKKAPSVLACDVSTSNNYFHGKILGDAAANFTTLMTNGKGVYCSTAQEDNATLGALLRAAKAKKVDFKRAIVMRTGAAFDRPPPGESAFQHLFYTDVDGFGPSVDNIYLAGIQVVKGILSGWAPTYKAGVQPTNYVGDIFGSLGGVPDFGPYPDFGEA